jgi:hypothetical protein
MKEDPKTRLALERNESKEGCRGAGFLPQHAGHPLPRRPSASHPAADTLVEVTAAATRAFNASVIHTGSSRFFVTAACPMVSNGHVTGTSEPL